MRIGNCRHCVAGERGGDMQSGGLSCHYWTHRTQDAADNWLSLFAAFIVCDPLPAFKPNFSCLRCNVEWDRVRVERFLFKTFEFIDCI